MRVAIDGIFFSMQAPNGCGQDWVWDRYQCDTNRLILTSLW
jgi:hypothetical protein